MDENFAESSWQLGRFIWAPLVGLKRVLRLTPFKHVFIASGAGVDGGSIDYANTLYRAKAEYFQNPRWSELADWEQELNPHCVRVETMLGVNTVPFESPPEVRSARFAIAEPTEK
ncbi:MAG: hypothetical protein QNJ40_16595 [Xanthomonadales bacterium]|nr:hypothetical protein [Xanthomonadales bacterium]